jgi:Tfp pilus assembly protein PilX
MTNRQRQQGATLLVALIMLTVLMMFLVSSLSTSTTNLKVVGNMQSKNEALNAAQEAIETVISTPLFIANPSSAVLNPCGTANTLCTDVTGDGTPEYTTTLTPEPRCITVIPITNAELHMNDVGDQACALGTQGQFTGVAGAATGNSLCAKTVWEITAETVGPATGASVRVTQGVGVRVSSDAAATSC